MCGACGYRDVEDLDGDRCGECRAEETAVVDILRAARRRARFVADVERRLGETA